MWTCQFHHMSYGRIQPVVQWLLSVHSVRCQMWADGHIEAAVGSGGQLAPWQLVTMRHWHQNQACMDVELTHRPLYSVSAPSSLVLPRIHACYTYKPVMGKSQSRIDWDLNRDLNHFCNSVSDVQIWFETLRFNLRFHLKILWSDLKNSQIVGNRKNSNSLQLSYGHRVKLCIGAGKMGTPRRRHDSDGDHGVRGYSDNRNHGCQASSM